jgi:hypothetical protein
VRNAYGDSLSWALCIAQPAVRAYAAALAAEAAAQPGTSGVELESCGWYGHAHLHAHDKTTGIGFGEAAQYLLSLCFCPWCRPGYASLGTDPGRLRVAVRDALEPLWRGERHGPGEARHGDDWAAVQALLGAEQANATLRYRLATARELRQEVIAAVRAQAGPGFRIVLHADPVPYRTGANPGVVVDDVLAGDQPARADGLVVPAAAVPAALASRDGPLPPGAVLAASHQIVSGMGGDPWFTPPAGATEIRLYHPGLASGEDLRAAAGSVARYRASRDGSLATEDTDHNGTDHNGTDEESEPPWTRS